MKNTAISLEANAPLTLRRESLKLGLVMLVSSLVLILAACSTESVPTPIVQEYSEVEISSDIRNGYYQFAGDTETVPVTYEVIDGLAIYQGDIILGNADEVMSKTKGLGTQAVGLKHKSYLWPNGVIPFMLDSSLKPESVIEITQAMAHWHLNTPIRFISYDAHIHTDYIRFKLGTDGGSCSSSVGLKKYEFGRRQYEQTILIAKDGRCGLGTLIHELGHTVGLKHEQARSDRDSHVNIHWGNINGQPADPANGRPFANPDRYKHNFCKVGQWWNKNASGENKCTGSSSNYVDLGPYDYESIMHYGYADFAKPGKFIIEPKTLRTDVWDGIGKIGQMGQRKGLSAGDIAAVNRLYAPGEAFHGNWNTSYGYLSLTNITYQSGANGVFGIYFSASNPQRINKLYFPYTLNHQIYSSTLIPAQAATLKGYWIETSSPIRCSTKQQGSYYWGKVEFSFDSDNLNFTGKWSYCDTTPTGSWIGTRIGAN